jgi:enoyl-CoA hydratase/carnithine racemase
LASRGGERPKNQLGTERFPPVIGGSSENGVSAMSGTDHPLVLRATDARGVVTLTLNRPAAFNALSEAMLAALQAELDALASEEAMGKALFYRQVESGTAAAYEDAGRTMACNMMNASALEGVQAFIDKRPPSWD